MILVFEIDKSKNKLQPKLLSCQQQLITQIVFLKF